MRIISILAKHQKNIIPFWPFEIIYRYKKCSHEIQTRAIGTGGQDGLQNLKIRNLRK